MRIPAPLRGAGRNVRSIALARSSDKPELRRQLRAVRGALSVDQRDAGSKAIARLGLSAIGTTPPRTISAYLAIGDEIDPDRLLMALHLAGHRLCLPVMVGKDRPLTFRAYAPGDALAVVQWGIREPKPERPEVLPDILLIPLLAADCCGQRLGYGGGYYDRTLLYLRALKTVTAIGLAFDAQVIDAVPHLDYDQRLDQLLTPSGLISCRS